MNQAKSSLLSNSIFWDGLFRGLSAPVTLFSTYEFPQIPNVFTIQVPTTPIDQVLANDWRRIGLDVSQAVEKYNVR